MTHNTNLTGWTGLTRRRFLKITGFAAGLAPCSGLAAKALATEAGEQLFSRWQGVALGARADVSISGLAKQQGEKILQSARREIDRLEQEFSLYRPDSALSKLNKDKRLPFPGSNMLALMSTVDTIHRASQGRFDPTIQPLWQAYAEAKGAPEENALERARKTIGWQAVSIDTSEIRLTRGGGLTLNGIAQGYITDRVSNLLRQNGVATALVEVGELSAIGWRSEQTGWDVHLSDSDGAVIELANSSMATSAPDGTVFGQSEDSQSRQSHILDPESGRPVQSDWLSATVIHPSAAIADACSTAACLMSPEEIRQMADSIGQFRFVGKHRTLGDVKISA